MENNRNQLPSLYPQLPPPEMENQQLRDYWCKEMEAWSDFKSHKFPLKRIHTIMKSDPTVKMVSAEAPILFSKACELLVTDLTTRAWLHAEENNRRTLVKSDISAAVARTCTFDFLVDILPKESFAAVPGFVAMPHLDGGVPPYYDPVVTGAMDPPVVDGSGMYAPPPTLGWPSPWTEATADGPMVAAPGDGENKAGESEG